MKPLPKQFTKGGFDYNLVERIGNTAIYHQTTGGRHRGFEVGVIRKNAARNAFGKHFDASESWPSSEEWGVRAWTYHDLAGAKRRMATLTPCKSP